MEAPYYRKYFNRFISIHCKKAKNVDIFINELETVENTINITYKRNKTECANFIKNFIQNRKFEVEIIFDGSKRIEYNKKTKKCEISGILN